jgi:SAM-dependent methyltransferase
VSDALTPSVVDLLAAWRARVVADKSQVERSREEPDPTDFYAPVATRFRMNPRRMDDSSLDALLSLANPGDVWLDVGSGGGRYALPVALHVREVVAIDPSPAMLSVLREDAAAEGIGNIRVIESRWPLPFDAGTPTGDVAFMAHVGYDIEEIGPFLDALESSSRRLCVAMMGESAMATVSTLFWNDIHGEPRVRLPALPEMLTLLLARGRLPEVTLVDRVPPTFDSFEEALAMARRQLWLRSGSAKDERLQAVAREALTERDGRFAFESTPTKIGIVSWSPR